MNIIISVVDQCHLDAGPDPTSHFDADPGQHWQQNFFNFIYFTVMPVYNVVQWQMS
jgi:hypothetical protein